MRQDGQEVVKTLLPGGYSNNSRLLQLLKAVRYEFYKLKAYTYEIYKLKAYKLRRT